MVLLALYISISELLAESQEIMMSVISTAAPTESKLMSIEELFAKYRPIDNPDESSHQGLESTWKNSLFSTSQHDKAYIQKLRDEGKDAYIWTVMHSDCHSVLWAESGFRVVNREGFLVMQEPFDVDGIVAADQHYKLEGKIVVNVEDFNDDAFETAVLEDLFEAASDEDDQLVLGITFDGSTERINDTFINIHFFMFYYDKPSAEEITLARELIKKAMNAMQVRHSEIKSYALDLEGTVKPFFN